MKHSYFQKEAGVGVGSKKEARMTLLLSSSSWWSSGYDSWFSSRLPRFKGLPSWLRGKEFTCQCRRHKRHQFDPWVRKSLWRRKWQPTELMLLNHGVGEDS